MSYRDAHTETKWGGVLGILCDLASTLSAIVLAAVALYLLIQDSNHSAYEPRLLLRVFVPTLILGIIAFCSPRSRQAAMRACLLGFGGITVLLCLDRFNILLQYDRWLERGMP